MGCVDGTDCGVSAPHEQITCSDKLTFSRFKTAYCTALEGEALPEIFGEMDVTADTLPAMADKIIATFSQ